MGLDIVELIMAVEDEFGIAIEDAEAQEIITVGQLHHLLLTKVSGENRDVCLTSASFWRTRKAVQSVLGLPKNEIRPLTPLASIIPEETRAAVWTAIEAALPLSMPKLEGTLFRKRMSFPKDVDTVGDLARQVLSLNYRRLAAEYKGWKPDDVWDTLVRVIVRQQGLDIEQVRPQARFVDDLGID